MDNFWLVQAVRYGLPAAFLLSLAFLSIVLAACFKKDLDDKTAEYRTGFVITMLFFFLTGWTVHFWNASYVLFIFLMGSGVWILDAPARESERALKQVSRKWEPVSDKDMRKIKKLKLGANLKDRDTL
jgi:hypothetical protein